MTPDTLLDIELSALLSRHQFTKDPESVVSQLRDRAANRPDFLDKVVGSWVGFYESEYTRGLCRALLAAFPGSASYVPAGASARHQPAHRAD